MYTKDGYTVTCSHVKRTFLDGSRTVEVLKDVNLNASRREFISIQGPSGSGKTTLLHIVAGLDRPTSGDVFIEGVLLNETSDEELSKIRRQKIGMVFQEFYLLPALSVLENVEVPMIINSVSEEERKKRAVRLLELVGLSNCAYREARTLSSGEKQRVQIARALANDPSIILADEPTGYLDTRTGRKIVELLKSIAENLDRTVLMVTHDSEAASLTHRILLLRKGILTPKYTSGKMMD